MRKTERVKFENASGQMLDASIEFPLAQRPHSFAIFAHCFTCNKNFRAVREISSALASSGFAVMSFDFTGLGRSDGDFSDTNFSSSVDDLVSAANFLADNHSSPTLLVGHSLGGSAAIFAAKQIASINAVVTVGSPADPKHVTRLFSGSAERISSEGEAEVSIGGTPFLIKKQFIEDLERQNLGDVLAATQNTSYLFMHSPTDSIVDISNAASLYTAARHPKSFISLDGADHLLTNRVDAQYAGRMIATWATKNHVVVDQPRVESEGKVTAYLSNEEIYRTDLSARGHRWVADEPEALGGEDFGPTPYELLSSALASCTVITLKMYASRKGWKIDEIFCNVSHSKTHLEDCQECDHPKSKVDQFERTLEIHSSLGEDETNRLLEIADKCPVHKTLTASSHIVTKLV